MDIGTPLEQVAQEYSTVPLDFNSENDAQARLYERTREWLKEDDALTTTISKGFDIKLEGNPPLYTG